MFGASRNEDIRDGASHAIFIGEKLAEPNDLGWMSGTRATLRNTGAPLNAGLHALTFDDASAENASGESSSDKNTEGNGTDASTKDVASSVPAAAADKTLYVAGFSSRHPTGVNFAFGDGSIRFCAGVN